MLYSWVHALTLILCFVRLVQSQKCRGQSCLIAALAGTSREGIEQIMAANGGQEPVGSNEKGKECIARHLTQFGAKPPAMLTSNTGKFKACSSRICITKRALNCQPYMNLFARGTAELGSLGQIIGPTLSRALAKSNGTPIVTAGLTYDADRAGINCLGMSGGVKCIEQLQQMAKQCPESQFFLSGYSQGAMVARICAAYSSKEIQQRIKGIVTFGDPFNGATVKGVSKDAIKVFCNGIDGVCQGKHSTTTGHFAYSTDSITSAAHWMTQRAIKQRSI